MSQNDEILKRLKAGKKITPHQALRWFGCFRLASRIHELRLEGNLIETNMIKMPSGARVAEYYMPVKARKRA